MYEGIHVDSISGDQPNSARTAAVDNFRAGKTWVLIATDLIGRGEPVSSLCFDLLLPKGEGHWLATHNARLLFC
jgi:hypothetical protein